MQDIFLDNKWYSTQNDGVMALKEYLLNTTALITGLLRSKKDL